MKVTTARRWLLIRAALCGLLTAGAIQPAAPLAAAASIGLGGTILVGRPTGVALVDPLSGDTTVLPIRRPFARPLGVAWSADRQQIAVSVQTRQAGERASGADILVIDRNGDEVSSIQRDRPEVALLSPIWLPSNEVAYERADVSRLAEPGRIEACQPDGSACQVLVSNARLPGLSPDGSSLAYVRPGAESEQLLVMDQSTGETHALVDNVSEGFAYFSRPRFSLDGQLVAFAASGGPNLARSLDRLRFASGMLYNRPLAASRRHGPSWDVWSIGADGSGLRQITQFDYEDDLAVAWSPDGGWLVAAGPNALYLVPVHLRGPATPIGRGGLGEPDWAPDQIRS